MERSEISYSASLRRYDPDQVMRVSRRLPGLSAFAPLAFFVKYSISFYLAQFLFAAISSVRTANALAAFFLFPDKVSHCKEHDSCQDDDCDESYYVHISYSPFRLPLRYEGYAAFVAAPAWSVYFSTKCARIFLEIMMTINNITRIAMAPGTNPAAT